MFRVLTVLTACAALCPAADPPAKDVLGDPLPKGAVARFGTERLRGVDPTTPAFPHPDGKRLIATVRGKISVLNPATGEVLGAFGPADVGSGLTDVSADGKRALAVTGDAVIVWETETGKVLYEEKRARRAMHTVRLSPDGKWLTTGAVLMITDRITEAGVKVTVYDVDAKKEHAKLTLAQNAGGALAVSADGKRAVTWGASRAPTQAGGGFGGGVGGGRPGAQDDTKDLNRTVQFWDVDKAKELGSARLDSPRASPPGLFGSLTAAIAPGGNVAAASSGDGTVILFDATTGKQLRELLGRTGIGQSLTFSPDGKTLAATANDGTVQLWDVESGKSLGLAPPPVHIDITGGLPVVTFNAAKTAVAVARSGLIPVMWEVPSGKALTPTVGHRRAVGGLVFTANDKEVISVGASSEVIRWGVDGKRLGDIAFTVPGGWEDSLARAGGITLPACGTIAVRHGTSAAVYDLPGGGQRFALPGSGSADHGVASASADGKTLAVIATNAPTRIGLSRMSKQRIVVVDVSNGTKSAEFTFPDGGVTGVWMSPDGTTLGVLRVPTGGGGQATVSRYSVADSKMQGQAEWKGGQRGQTAITPDGKGALTTTESGVMAVFDFATGEKGRELKGVDGTVTTPPVFNRDGKRVAVPTEKEGVRTVRVFDWESGKLTHTFSGHAAAISCLAFSTDGKTLATGSYDTTVLLWDLSKE